MMKFINQMTNISIQLFIIPMICMIIYADLNCNEYFYSWMFMESTYFLFMFMLMISKKKTMMTFIFFLINFISSMILLMCLILMDNKLNLNYDITQMINFLLFLMITMKNGMFPFNNWMIYSIKYMNWTEMFMFSTLLKYIPMNLFFKYNEYNNYLMIILIMNMLFSSMTSFNENNIKKIIAYSSILHSSMMMILCWMNFYLFNLYFNLYMTMTFLFLIMLSLLNYIKNNSMFLPKSMKLMFTMYMFIYSSLPPFMSFYIKWLSVEMMNLLDMNYFIIILILISSTLMSWNYLTIMKYFYLNNNNNNKIKLKLNYSFLNFNFNLIFYFYTMLFLLFMNYFYTQI